VQKGTWCVVCKLKATVWVGWLSDDGYFKELSVDVASVAVGVGMLDEHAD
jgi:hypothetical protein